MVDDREPRYRLVDPDGETVLASFYEREDGSIAIEHSSGEAIAIDADGLTTGNFDADSATIEGKASPYATESEVNEKADDPHDNTAHSETYATTAEVDEKADDPHGDAAHSEDYAKSDDNVEGFSTAGADGTVPTSQGDGTLAMETVDVAEDVTIVNPTEANDGEEPTATGEDAVALGVINAQALGSNNIALGNDALADSGTGGSATALGSFATATGAVSTALGNATDATAGRATAVGRNAEATASDSTALGVEAVADGESSIALGDGANTEGETKFAVAFGSFDGNKLELDEDGNLSVEGEFVGVDTAGGVNLTTSRRYGLLGGN